MIQIKPSQFTRNPDSDSLGSLWSTFGLDLTSNKNHIRVSPRMIIGTDAISNLGVAVNFERFNGGSGQNGFFTIAGDRAFSSGSVDASAVFAASTGSATDHSSDTADVMFFRQANKLLSTRQTDYQFHDGSSWTNAGSGPHLTSGTVHMMTQYGVLAYVTDAFKSIWPIDASMSITNSAHSANTFTLGTYSSNSVGLFFSDILGASSTIWLFTINGAAGQPARVFTWDGATADTPTNSQGYVLDSGGVVAAILVNDSPIIMNVDARLQQFNGQTFVDVPNGRLPIDKDKFLKNAFSSSNNRFIHPRGLRLYPGNRIRGFFNNVYEDGTIAENFPAGIYEFDLGNPNLGWTHITTPSLYTASVTGYGQERISQVGALFYGKTSTGKGINLIGAQVYTDASTTKNIIATDDTDDVVQKYGYFVTDKITSPNILDSWNKIILRFKKLLASTDSITVKYRTTEATPSEATITWVDTNTFTSTADLSAYAIGDEVEILQGTGSGKCAHISAISANAGTYTVDLDDTFTGVTTGTAKARFQHWTKIGTCTDQTLQVFDPTIINAPNSTWIQFKVCMQFTGKDEVDDLTIINEPAQPAQ